MYNSGKKEPKQEVCGPETGPSRSATPTDVYNVIRSQNDDDLVSARPHSKNTSFLCSSPDTPTGDYDNLGGRDTESGFVTLASTESCFLNLDLNDLTPGRRGAFQDTSWGRSGKRDGGLGYSIDTHRELYDRSLGRRATKSEHYGSSLYGDGLFDEGIRRGSDLYDPKTRPAGHTMKADLYQTFGTNGSRDVYQTCLAPPAGGKNVDWCRRGLTLDGRGPNFSERDWRSRENY